MTKSNYSNLGRSVYSSQRVRAVGPGMIGSMDSGLSYDIPGATDVTAPEWTVTPPGYRRYESTTRIGHGTQAWEAAATAVMRWEVKTRSGFSIETIGESQLEAQEGQDRVLVARIGPFGLREPVWVVALVDEPNRAGFAYGTREGHPVSGEEAFVVHRSVNGDVFLTLRSLTRSGSGLWRLAFPAVLVAQRWYRSRYRASLLSL